MSELSEVLINTQELKDPIFVVGCLRSGTGALARTIGLAEPVCYVGETKLFTNTTLGRFPLFRHFDIGEMVMPYSRS